MSKLKITYFTLLCSIMLIFTYSIRSILPPFVISIILAYIMNPAVSSLNIRYKVSRNIISLVIVTILSGFFLLSFALMLPILYIQLVSFITDIPTYADYIKNSLLPELFQYSDNINPKIKGIIQSKFENINEYLIANMKDFAQYIFSSGMSILHIISLIVITPVVTYYLLCDWVKFVNSLDNIIPKKYIPTILVLRMNRTLRAYLRGQSVICLILMVYYLVTLTAVGLNRSVLISFFSGLMCFIPYLGTFLTTIIVCIVSFFQYNQDPNSYYYFLSIVIILGVGQFIEGNILTPRLLGKKVDLHPIWIMFSMLAGGSLLGILGMIISVPVSAIIGTIIRFIWSKYITNSMTKKRS